MSDDIPMQPSHDAAESAKLKQLCLDAAAAALRSFLLSVIPVDDDLDIESRFRQQMQSLVDATVSSSCRCRVVVERELTPAHGVQLFALDFSAIDRGERP